MALEFLLGQKWWQSFDPHSAALGALPGLAVAWLLAAFSGEILHKVWTEKSGLSYFVRPICHLKPSGLVHSVWMEIETGWTQIVLLMVRHSRKISLRLKKFSLTFFFGCMLHLLKECYMLAVVSFDWWDDLGNSFPWKVIGMNTLLSLLFVRWAILVLTDDGSDGRFGAEGWWIRWTITTVWIKV